MPFVLHPRVRKGLGKLAALTAFGVLASTGVAAAACPPQPTSTPFLQWGDNFSYFLAPGGSFEGARLSPGWTATNAALVAGNEPFYVNSPSDRQSLLIRAGGVVTTPFICLDRAMPYFRLFAYEAGRGSDLKVTLLVKRGGGVPHHYAVTDLADGSMPSWAPTARLAASDLKIPDGTTVQAALRFEVPAATGSWQIDDLYIDPYRTG